MLEPKERPSGKTPFAKSAIPAEDDVLFGRQKTPPSAPGRKFVAD
jgi:hypothetical protein